jgi:hypothetical protein
MPPQKVPTRLRLYDHLLADHFREHRQMAFVAGPRPFVAADCFSRKDPVVVPTRTFLSQLP